MVKTIKKYIHYATHRLVDPFTNMYRRPANFLYKLFHYLPIQKKVVLFESEPDFCDNSWALYEYLKTNRPDYKLVWVLLGNVFSININSNSKIIFVKRGGRGMHIKALYYYATAKFSFYTHATRSQYIPRKEQVVINLWHGIPYKASKMKNPNYYNWLISSGYYTKRNYAQYLGCDINKVLPLGNPRNDLLLKNIGSGKDNPYYLPQTDKVIIWMPTFRKSISTNLSENLCDTSTGLPLLDSEDEFRKFDSFLQGNNTMIIIKVHHLQAKKEIFKKKFNNIVILTDDILAQDKIQLYQMIGKTDALLTDYSSIMFDYLLTDKPIGFILDDIDKYKESCGFLIDDPRTIMKGHHIYTQEQLKDFVFDVLNGKDDYQADRKKLCLKVHDAADGSACENIVRYFNI